MQRAFMVLLLVLAVAASIASSSGAGATSGHRTTDRATAFFSGPGPANVGLENFRLDLTVSAQTSTWRDSDGLHQVGEWFDEFTIFDPATGAALLNCTAGGPLPENGFDAAELTLAALDGTDLSMTPGGGSGSGDGFDDATLCPGLSLRVILVWHAVGNEEKETITQAACTHQTRLVSATASGVTINSPDVPGPSIPLGPSLTATIGRDVAVNC